MAITRVSPTRNGASAIRYTQEKKKKENTEGKDIIDRVLAVQGNCLDPQRAVEQMQDVWKSFGKDKGENVQAYRIIQSFSEDELKYDITDVLSYENEENVRKANEVGLKLAEELFPGRQALIVTQADGKGHKLHNHIVVNSVSPIDGKSLRADSYAWKTISTASDKIIQEYDMQPLDKTKKNSISYGVDEVFILESGRESWKDKIRSAVDDVKERDNVVSFDDFKQHLKDDFDVEVILRGKTLTYQINFDDDKTGKILTRKSRAKKLGNDYSLEEINRGIERQATKRQEIAEFRSGIKRFDEIKADEREPVERQISERSSGDRNFNYTKRKLDSADERSEEPVESDKSIESESNDVANSIRQIQERLRFEESERKRKEKQLKSSRVEQSQREVERNESIARTNKNSKRRERDNGIEF